MNLEHTEQLSGTFVLNDTSRYQFFYCSQNYGTFYAIYMKMHFSKGMLSALTFKLVNYKGNLDLGFPENAKELLQVKLINHQLNIDFKVQGLASCKEFTYEFPEKNIYYKDIQTIYGVRDLLPMGEGALHNGVFDTEFYERQGVVISKKETLPQYNQVAAIGRNCRESSLIAIFADYLGFDISDFD